MHDHPESHRPRALTPAIAAEPNPPGTPFDFMPLAEAVLLRWRQLLVVGLLCGLTTGLAAWAFFRPSYSASVQLSRYESPLASDDYHPQSYDTGMLFGLISAPDRLQKARAQQSPASPAGPPPGRLVLTIDRNSTLITVTATSPTPEAAVALANLIGQESVKFTQSLQQVEAQEATQQLDQQLADNQADRLLVRQRLALIETERGQAELPPLSATANAGPASGVAIPSPRTNRLYDRVQAAREQLDELQTRFTEAHPLVREQKVRLAALTAQLPQPAATPGTNPVSAEPVATSGALRQPPTVAALSSGYEALAMTLGVLENRHTALVTRQRSILPFLHSPPGSLRQLNAATPGNVLTKHTAPLVAALTLLGSLAGATALMVLIVLRELFDDRVKTGADLARITGLPLLGSVGDLDDMTPADKAHWALLSWTALRGHLSVIPGQGIVCGFTSAGVGEGRSTWIELLAGSARQCGFNVLIVSADTATGIVAELNTPVKSAAVPVAPCWGSPEYTAMIVSDPSRLVESSSQPDGWPADSLPLPREWIWDLERRNQWQRALQAWRNQDNLVILVDLPSMTSPETMLLVEKMPNLVWLAESHKTEAGETLEHLENLRHARCHLVGTVLNRTPNSARKLRFARWFGRRSLLLATAFGLAGAPVSAQTRSPDEGAGSPKVPQAAALALVDTTARAPWQQRFTLGPGDQIQINAFGQAEPTATSVLIGPDGRISYLEAQNLKAAGLTVDELRSELNRELGKFRNTPEIIVRPAIYRSKRYYVLGAVVKKGAFPLNRPLTLIEAVAQAQGLETRVMDRSLVVQADLANSFISRQGQHLPVDFKKLFAEGDLSQNIAIEPDDYLYFPPYERAQIYVLGEVRYPGGLTAAGRTGTMEAIAVRGGFSERAWPKRLLVIRGSLQKPQTFIVNANDILAAKSPDFQLQPRDIIYVSSRPWYKAEELLDLAATAFVQSAVVTKTGLSVTPIGTR
jgi:protein involved in polysaccharide export with SLBB domain/capsular polysaccharide biosynthesis protein